MKIVRERDSFKAPFCARGLCDCGCEMELPLESRIYIECPGCGERYDCDGEKEPLEE